MSLGPTWSLVRHEIALGICEDHVTNRLMIFDVAGAAADVSVERLSNGLFEFSPRHRRFGEALQQHLALVQEAGRAIAALEREVLDECPLQRCELAILRMPFDGANGLAIKTHRRHDAGRAGETRSVCIVDDNSAAQ